MNPYEIKLGDIITMKKIHPCGGNTWEITRLGVDIKLKCTTCQRIIMIPRLELLKKAKK